MDYALDLLARHLGDYAYLGLFLILSVGAFGAPIPEEVVLVAAGLFVHQGQTRLLPTLIVCGLGQVVGDFLLYMVGRRWGTGAFHGFIRRLVPPERIERVQRRLDRWGLVVVFFGRYLTGVRPAVFLGAGASGIPYLRFALVDGASALVSLLVWVWVGRAASGWIELVLQRVSDAESLILSALGAVVLVIGLERALVRLGRLGERSTTVRVTNFVRVPILLVTATFAVVLARERQIHQREHLIAAAQQGSARVVKDMGLLMNVLPAITNPDHPPEIMLVGTREMVEAALASAGYHPGTGTAAGGLPIYPREADALLVRERPDGTEAIAFWLSSLEYRGRLVWLGRFSSPPTASELESLSQALIRSRHTPRTLVGPRLGARDRRRVLVAVLRTPVPRH